MTGLPDLPGGEITDTETPGVRIGETEVEPLPGGDLPESGQQLDLSPQNRRLFVQEVVRASLAISFLVLFTLVVILGFLKVGTGAWNDAKEYLQILIPALSALLGSATGFYFGTRR